MKKFIMLVLIFTVNVYATPVSATDYISWGGSLTRGEGRLSISLNWVEGSLAGEPDSPHWKLFNSILSALKADGWEWDYSNLKMEEVFYQLSLHRTDITLYAKRGDYHLYLLRSWIDRGLKYPYFRVHVTLFDRYGSPVPGVDPKQIVEIINLDLAAK